MFKYNDIMNRWDVNIPFTLKTDNYKEDGVQHVASISESKGEYKITLHKDINITLMRQILLNWDEFLLELTEEEELI